MFKSVIFDMDGVLVNTEPIHYKMYQEFFWKRGMEISYDIYEPCIGSTVENLRKILIDTYQIDIRDPKNWEEIQGYETAIIERDGYGDIPGIREFVKNLHENGIRLAVASSSFYDQIIKTIKAIGIYEYFDKIVSGADVAHPKPAPDVFLKAMKELGVQPEECVIVEDSFNGVRAAKAAGAACMGFYNPDSGKQDLSLADIIIEGFEEVDTAFARKLHHRVFGIPMTIAENDSYRLREMKKEDFEAVRALYQEPGTLAYMDSFFPEKDEQDFFDSYVEHMYSFYDLGMYALEEKKTGKIIGHVGFGIKEGKQKNSAVTLGYVISKSCRRQGAAQWACRKALEYVQNTIDHVEIYVHPENKASIALAEKLADRFSGFVRLFLAN